MTQLYAELALCSTTSYDPVFLIGQPDVAASLWHANHSGIAYAVYRIVQQIWDQDIHLDTASSP